MKTIDIACMFAIPHTDMTVSKVANVSAPPDGFDPNRDGAALWLAMRMRYRNLEACSS